MYPPPILGGYLFEFKLRKIYFFFKMFPSPPCFFQGLSLHYFVEILVTVKKKKKKDINMQDAQ